jgi:hypothetical protein
VTSVSPTHSKKLISATSLALPLSAPFLISLQFSYFGGLWRRSPDLLQDRPRSLPLGIFTLIHRQRNVSQYERLTERFLRWRNLPHLDDCGVGSSSSTCRCTNGKNRGEANFLTEDLRE